MDIRSAIVDGIRVFSVADIGRILGVQSQTLRHAMNQPQGVYFNVKRPGDDMSHHLLGFPFCEVERVLEKRAKRDRIGSNLVPSILEWMSAQSNLENVETVSVTPDFTKMTPEEIYKAGLMDQFVEFAAQQKVEAEKRNESLKVIKAAKDLLDSLN